MEQVGVAALCSRRGGRPNAYTVSPPSTSVATITSSYASSFTGHNSNSSNSSSSSSTCSSTASTPSMTLTSPSSTSSILSQLERVVTDDATTGAASSTSSSFTRRERRSAISSSELPLLWSAVAESAPHTECNNNDNNNNNGRIAACASPPHAQFVRDVTGLLWGADYPSWMKELWVRQGDLDAGEEEEEGEEAYSAGERGMSSSATTTTYPPAPSPHPSEPKRHVDGAGGVTRAATTTSLPEEPQQKQQEDEDRVSALQLSTMMQQALDALQLSLLLQEPESRRQPTTHVSTTTSSSSISHNNHNGDDGCTVEALARNLVEDAPLLWLRYLLVPMYIQWTQLRRSSTTTTTTASSSSYHSSQWACACTMQQLLHAISTSGLRAALRKEKDFADDELCAVRNLPDAVDDTTPKPSSAGADWKSTAARDALRELRRRQRRHVGELLCFAGTLARAAHSFMVLGGGGVTLLCVFVVRLMGHARAVWGAWARTRTAAQLSRTGPLRWVLSHSTGTHQHCLPAYDDDYDDVISSGDDTAGGGVHHGHDAEQPKKRPRAEGHEGRRTGFQDTTDTLAAVRVVLAAAARQHAAQLWRCWVVLFGFYGADVYANDDDAVARAMGDNDNGDDDGDQEAETAGLRGMTSAQRAQWRRLRMAARVQQHTLSEAHWLWCRTTIAYVERAVDDVVAAETGKDGSTMVLYRRLLAATLREFFRELRDVLQRYGQAMLGLRSGGLQGGATAVVPDVLRSSLSNVLSLQAVFTEFLASSLQWTTSADADADEVGQGRKVARSVGEKAGTYLWALHPTLLRTQAPEAVTWMGTGGNATEYTTTAAGGDDEDEVAAAEFHEQYRSFWRHRGSCLAALLADTSCRMEAVLTRIDAAQRGVSAASNQLKEGASTEVQGDDTGALAGYGDVVSAFEDVVFDDVVTRGPVAVDSTKSGLAVKADSVAAVFATVYDATCFFALQPERQRVFTRSVHALCSLLSEGSDSSSNDYATESLVASLRRDTQLWMLLAHGVLLQLERRGRLAREDEALCISGLVPLLSVLSSSSSSSSNDDDNNSCASAGIAAAPQPLPRQASNDNGDDDGDDDDKAKKVNGGAGGGLGAPLVSALPLWADLVATQDLLLLLASGLLRLPWSVEQLYLAVQRHSVLCARYGQPARRIPTRLKQARARWYAGVARAVAGMTQWFTADPPTTPAPAAHDAWGLADAAPSSSQTSKGRIGNNNNNISGGGQSDLPQVCAHIDGQLLRSDDFLRRLHADDVSPLTHPTAQGGATEVTDTAIDESFAAALDRHTRVTAAFTSAAACGLLLVVGAYRSLSRTLYTLRATMEEQRRLARDDDVGEYVGRSVTFCTTADVLLLRTTLTVVHRCVFEQHCQPAGLLRLWLSYLQLLFTCVVPLSAASGSSGSNGVTGEAETLVLMPTSWQRRHHVVSVFGERVCCTGWRALQHDGEATSHTRLREVLGESLADLMLMPYLRVRGVTHTTTSTTTEKKVDDDGDFVRGEAAVAVAAGQPLLARSAVVLPHTLPHVVLEVLCELLAIPLDLPSTTTPPTIASTPAMDACGRGVERSFLGVAGLLAFLRRVELRVVPGSLQDRRLEHVLRCVYAAADAAAVGV